MTEDFVRSALRLVAVVVVVVGFCMTIHTVVSLLAASRAMAEAPAGLKVDMSGAISQLGLFAVLRDMATSAVGCALFAISPSLAPKIVE